MPAARRIRPNLARKILLRLANDALRRYPRRYRVAETEAGQMVDGDTSDLIERYLYVFGTWEPTLSTLLRTHLRPGDVFVDIGANVGYFTMLAAHAVGASGHVIAVEPVPATVRKLRKNLAANGAGNVTVLPYAASDAAGHVQIFSGPPTNVGKSGTSPVAGGRAVGPVRQVVAADAVPVHLRASLRAIKVDVEGDELRVLRGLQPLLERLPAGAWVVAEVAPDRLQQRGHSGSEVFELMLKLGFEAQAIPNDYHPAAYAEPQRGPEVIPLDHPPDEMTDVIFSKLPS